MAIKTIIWDLGGVLLDWSPHYVFTDDYFASKEEKDHFFNHICTSDWNEEQDAGRSIVEATQLLVEQFPGWEKPIRDFYGRWTEMLKGPVHDTVAIFRQLKTAGTYKQYALTNWQADLFHIALVRYDFLHWFDGRVVSGEEKTRKPFPEFYQRLLDRYAVKPEEALFIDDNLRNVLAARELNINTHHFLSARHLTTFLKEEGLL
ncbi:MAG: HAD family phosphatase [Chitinophagaceae bacterium]